MPSSGCASSNASTPPKSLPTLPSRMQLALPLYQPTPSTLILAPNGFDAQILRAAQDVGDAAEALLQPAVAGVADHRGVEAGAGHDREPLAVEAADVERRRSPCRPIATASPMSLGIPRFEANRFAVPAGMIARLAFEPASTSTQRCTIPSPPQAKTSSAPSSSARRTCAGALRLFGTSHQNGRRPPRPRGRGAARAGRRRGSCRNARRPRPSLASLCARRRRAPAARQANTTTTSAAIPTTTPPADVERMVHAAIHARQRDERRRSPPRSPRRTPANDAVREPRGQQQHEAAVDRDRGGRVAGRIAGVDRQALEPDDTGPVLVDDERRRAVRRRLDGEGEHGERGDPPFPQQTHTSAIAPTTIGSTTPPATIEPISEASVRADVRWAASQTSKCSLAARCPRRARARG